jgi:DNA-binding transcriptional MocR family regulator
LKTRRDVEIVVSHVRPRQRAMWRQLAAALQWQMDIGRLAAGSRLPATRTLARHLGISRNTVVQAYDELVSLGYVRLHVGDGAYVCAVDERRSPPFFACAHSVGVAPDGVPLVLARNWDTHTYSRKRTAE